MAAMKEVRFLEKLAERLVEGGFNRVLKPRLQPVQIAKALARGMERSQMVGTDSPLVANRYRVYLHPVDHQLFAGFRTTLERELAVYLSDLAARRGWRPIAPPAVEILPADHSMKADRISVDASMEDADSAHSLDSEPSDHPPAPWMGTVEMPAIRPAAPQPGQHSAALEDPTGRSYDLIRPDTTIGRAVDNDIILESKQVSRHHARILWQGGSYLILDLGSANGTFVFGQKVDKLTLSDGDLISLGGLEFTFRLPVA